MTSATNPLVAARADSTGTWAGIGLAEDIELLVSSFDSGSWIDGSIGGFAAGLDVLATVTDPLGQLVSWGVAWLIEHVKPLSDALDWLAGDPDQITAYAGTWTNVAAAMRDAAADLDAAIRADLLDWQSSAADAYRQHAGEQHEALSAAGQAAEAMSTITVGTGLVVALVREVVRDLIADFVSVLAVRLWEWLAIAGGTLGVGLPWVAAQVSSLAAKWAAKIARLLTGLISSLRRLAPMLSKLDDILRQLHEILARLARHEPTGRLASNGKSNPEEPSQAEKKDVENAVPGEPDPPAFENPIIDNRKIAGYAMNPDHPVGKNKYRVINAATGLDQGDSAAIEQQIREGVRRGRPLVGKADEYGQRWSVDVELTGPKGGVLVRTAWIVDSSSPQPRMTTISFPPKNG